MQVYLFCEISQVSEVQSSNLNEDCCDENGHKDELVEVVQMLVLERCDSDCDHEPEGKVADVEKETHLQGKVRDDLVAQAGLGGLEASLGLISAGYPRKHRFREPLESVFSYLQQSVKFTFILLLCEVFEMHLLGPFCSCCKEWYIQV